MMDYSIKNASWKAPLYYYEQVENTNIYTLFIRIRIRRNK